jgi:protein-disulfide isomerase
MKQGDTRVVTFVLGAIIIFTAGIFLGQFLSTGAILGNARTEESPPSPAALPDQAALPPAKPIEETGGVGSLPPKGNESAPVTIIEFSEYQCPYCGKYVRETLSQLDKEYIQTGKVKYYFRDFPLSFHQYAQKAAEAARCANDQGKLWEYHDKVFEEQDLLSLEKLKEWAEGLGLNAGEFNKCLDEGKYKEAVKKDFSDGQAAGVQGTPSFFINGKPLRGAQPYESFKTAIDEALGED